VSGIASRNCQALASFKIKTMNPTHKKIAEVFKKSLNFSKNSYTDEAKKVVEFEHKVLTKEIANIYEEEEENKPTNFTCEYKFDKFNKTQFLKIARGEK